MDQNQVNQGTLERENQRLRELLKQFKVKENIGERILEVRLKRIIVLKKKFCDTKKELEAVKAGWAKERETVDALYISKRNPYSEIVSRKDAEIQRLIKENEILKRLNGGAQQQGGSGVVPVVNMERTPGNDEVPLALCDIVPVDGGEVQHQDGGGGVGGDSAVAGGADQPPIPSTSTEPVLSCDRCHKIYKKPGWLRKHRLHCEETVHRARARTPPIQHINYNCLDVNCGRQFNARKPQNRHMGLFHGFTWKGGHLQCALCIKTFQTKESFEAHKRECHDCPSGTPGRMTTRKRALNR